MNKYLEFAFAKKKTKTSVYDVRERRATRDDIEEPGEDVADSWPGEPFPGGERTETEVHPGRVKAHIEDGEVMRDLPDCPAGIPRCRKTMRCRRSLRHKGDHGFVGAQSHGNSETTLSQQEAIQCIFKPANNVIKLEAAGIPIKLNKEDNKMKIHINAHSKFYGIKIQVEVTSDEVKPDQTFSPNIAVHAADLARLVLETLDPEYKLNREAVLAK